MSHHYEAKQHDIEGWYIEVSDGREIGLEEKGPWDENWTVGVLSEVEARAAAMCLNGAALP